MPFKDILTSLDSPRLMLKTLVRFTLSVSLGQKMSSISLIFSYFQVSQIIILLLLNKNKLIVCFKFIFVILDYAEV